MASFGMTVAAGEVARLCRDHHFVLRGRAHIERLVGARAGRKDVGSGVEQRFYEALSKRGAVNTAARGHYLKPHAGVDSLSLKKTGELPNVFEPSAGAAAHLRDVHGHAQRFPARLYITYGRRACDLRLDPADIDLADLCI